MKNKQHRSSAIVLLLVLCLTTFTACDPKVTGFVMNGEAFEVEAIEAFTYLSSRTRMSFDNGESTFRGNANIRIKRDSAVWVSFSPGLGVEAMRCLITQDSIHLINKINREYYSYDLQTLSQLMGFPVSYRIVENALLGNVTMAPDSKDIVMKAGDTDAFLIRQERGEFRLDHLIDPVIRRVKALDVQMEGSTARANMVFSNYKSVEDTHLLPYGYVLNLFKGSPGEFPTTIELNHRLVVIDQGNLEFPFTISNKYTKKELPLK